MTRILQPLEMQMRKTELEMLLQIYKHTPSPKPENQIPAVPRTNEKVLVPRRKKPVFRRIKEHRFFKALFYDRGHTNTILL